MVTQINCNKKTHNAKFLNSNETIDQNNVITRKENAHMLGRLKEKQRLPSSSELQ